MVGYMDSSTSHQEMGLQTLESMLTCNKTQQEKKPRPADMQALKCPRCDSANTKFCYYNNYSLSQPRYFCKSCRRYWTKGGTLRNVPVGGGCRKNKRSSSSSSSSSRRSQDQQPITSPIPSMGYDSNDLTLAIARLQKQNSGNGFEDYDYSSWGHHHHGDVIGSFGGNQNQNPSSSGLFDSIRSGFLENSGGGNGFQNLYYGMGNGNVEMGMNGSQDMGMGYEEFGGVATSTTASTAVTTVKQEVRGGGDGVDGRVLWGLPWQSLGGDGNGPDLDSGRLNWNGIGPLSNWHGVLNSPLM